MTAAPDDRLAEAFRAFETGDLTRADCLTAALVDDFPNDARVDVLAGQVAFRAGRNADAARHLRVAVDAVPGNVPLRVKLGAALVALGDLPAALALTDTATDPALRRIAAVAAQHLGQHAVAINHYRTVVRAVPGDHESWHGLGLCLLQVGQLDDALQAIARAADAANRPDYVVSLSRALAAGERHAERRDVIAQCLARHDGDAALHLEHAMALSALDDTDGATAAFERALDLRSHDALAYLDYGMFLEARNRLDAMAALIERAGAAGVGGNEIAFLDAYLLWRRGRHQEADSRLRAVQGGINPARHKQLEGQIADALNDPPRAFAAFAAMNAADAAMPAARRARHLNFIAEVRRDADALRQISAATDGDHASAPVFVMGFPRSGTTLLDTFLRNLPDVMVLEEPGMIEAAHARRAEGSVVSAEAYFADLESRYGAARGLVIDKHPLHTARIATIHALFPDARLVFVERHPCDVILSCFMSRFQTNKAMVCFQSLEAAASLYDATMTLWSRAVAELPLNVHRVRYERVVDDTEREVRALTEFLGRDWSPAILENQASAARRERIATASYAQVGQPIYNRARYRWVRYRDQLKPVLPILESWATAMGYSVSDID